MIMNCQSYLVLYLLETTMSNLKSVNDKLFQIQMLLEEAVEELKQANDEADQEIAKLQTSNVITKSQQFVFGE